MMDKVEVCFVMGQHGSVHADLSETEAKQLIEDWAAKLIGNDRWISEDGQFAISLKEVLSIYIYEESDEDEDDGSDEDEDDGHEENDCYGYDTEYKPNSYYNQDN